MRRLRAVVFGFLAMLVLLVASATPATAALFRVGSAEPIPFPGDDDVVLFIDFAVDNGTGATGLPSALQNLTFTAIGFAFFASEDAEEALCDGSVFPGDLSCRGDDLTDEDRIFLDLPIQAGSSSTWLDLMGLAPSLWVQVFVQLTDSNGALPLLASTARFGLTCTVDQSCGTVELLYNYDVPASVPEPTTLALLLTALAAAGVRRRHTR